MVRGLVDLLEDCGGTGSRRRWSGFVVVAVRDCWSWPRQGDSHERDPRIVFRTRLAQREVLVPEPVRERLREPLVASPAEPRHVDCRLGVQEPPGPVEDGLSPAPWAGRRLFA